MVGCQQLCDFWSQVRCGVTSTAFRKAYTIAKIKLDTSKVVEIMGNDISNEMRAILNSFFLDNGFEQPIEIFLDEIGCGERSLLA
jgi:hypothetical protein